MTFSAYPFGVNYLLFLAPSSYIFCDAAVYFLHFLPFGEAVCHFFSTFENVPCFLLLIWHKISLQNMVLKDGGAKLRARIASLTLELRNAEEMLKTI